MSSHHHYRTCLIGSLLLLTAPVAVDAGEGWSCIADSGGNGWNCRGQGDEAAKTPTARPAPTLTKTLARTSAAAIETQETRQRPALPPAKTPLSPRKETSGGTAQTDEIAITEPKEQTTKQSSAKTSAASQVATEAVPSPVAVATSRQDRGREVADTAVGNAGTGASNSRDELEANKPPNKQAATAPTAGSKIESSGELSDSAAAKPDAQITRALDAGMLHEGQTWEYCGKRPVRLGPAVLPPQPSEEDQLFLSADTFDYDPELELLWLSGDVRMAQGSRRVGADKIVYDRDSTDLVAKGNVFLANPGIRLVADEAQVNLESDQGNLTEVQYRLVEKSNARGSADRAELLRPTLTRYQNILYTTCRPGQDDWSLDAAELELDQAKGQGVARHAKLRVGGLPVFYTPYMSFPIDDRRKSGILVPTFGNSDTSGIDVTVPYYWNIAPNMDATFFPRYLSKRGPMLGTEFRYLSSRQRAEFYGEIIPTDHEREDQGARWGYRVEQNGSFAPRWSTAVNFNAVSDDEFLEDFGNRLDLTSTRNIERRGDLTYRSEDYRWHLIARLQDYQTVDPTLPPELHPYARLPQLLFAMNPYQLDPGIELGASAEYDYFAHDVQVFGNRATLQPYARWPLHRSYGHLIPELNFYLAGYDLRDQEPDKSERPSYAIPSFNLDAELVFERTVKWFDREALQTLEPRLFYLYTAFQDQDDIPVFDSAELSFSYNSLFRRNRFSGSDRIGDANQLTLGLTSRTLAQDSGAELLRASIGQVLYFRDRDVQILGEPQAENSSSIAGELSARLLENWTGRASVEYDPNEDSEQTRKRVFELHYQTANDRLLNLTYRFDIGTSEATSYEDTDLSFRLPVNRQLQLVGRWNYSLENAQTVEAFAGLEYGQCCWRMRLVGRHLKNKPESAGSNSVMVQFELAGLGSIGQQVDKLFEQGIYGYQAY